MVCVPGDVTEPDLGLSKENYDKLLEEVTVVFHSAATVKFNESLDTAVALNTLGTQKVLLFCRKMKKLKVGILFQRKIRELNGADYDMKFSTRRKKARLTNIGESRKHVPSVHSDLKSLSSTSK